jgi:hypothetical protein
MTEEEFLRGIDAAFAKVLNDIAAHKAKLDGQYGTKSISTLTTPQEECKAVLREIESIVRRAQRASTNGRVYIPPQVRKLADEISHGLTVEKRLGLLKEIRDHLQTTNLHCRDRESTWLH